LIQAQLTEKQALIYEKKKFLENQVSSNQDLEHKIAAQDRLLAKLRADFTTSQSGIAEYEDELETVKNTLQKAANNLEQHKHEITQYHKEIEIKLARVEKAKQQFEKTKSNLQQHYQHSSDLDQRAKQV
jgi:chromosome segregation ATPase